MHCLLGGKFSNWHNTTKKLSSNDIHTFTFKKIEPIILVSKSSRISVSITNNDVIRKFCKTICRDLNSSAPDRFHGRDDQLRAIGMAKLYYCNFFFKSMHNLNPSAEKKPEPRHYPWINPLLVSARFTYVFFLFVY